MNASPAGYYSRRHEKNEVTLWPSDGGGVIEDAPVAVSLVAGDTVPRSVLPEVTGMRHAAVVAFLVLALVLLGCSKKTPPIPNQSPDPPPVAVQTPKEEAAYHNAEKGALQTGVALVSVEATQWQKYRMQYPTVMVLIDLYCFKSGQPLVVKGWAYDEDVIKRITGRGLDAGDPQNPHAVTFAATTDSGETLRGMMRSLSSAKKGETIAIGTREWRLLPGHSVRWMLTFERPGPQAKELRIDLDASDFGGTGRLRFRMPSQQEWRPKS